MAFPRLAVLQNPTTGICGRCPQRVAVTPLDETSPCPPLLAALHAATTWRGRYPLIAQNADVENVVELIGDSGFKTKQGDPSKRNGPTLSR